MKIISRVGRSPIFESEKIRLQYGILSIARMVKMVPTMEYLQVHCAFKIHITNGFFSHEIMPLSEITDWTI